MEYSDKELEEVSRISLRLEKDDPGQRRVMEYLVSQMSKGFKKSAILKDLMSQGLERINEHEETGDTV